MIKPSKSLLDMYVIERVILSDSITVKVGDAVIINPASPKFATNAAGTVDIILGTVLTIKNGVAGGSAPLQVESITTAFDNTTNAQISVDILASQNICTYVADLNDDAGTTPNSEYFGYFNLDGTDSGLLDEASYLPATEQQFLSYGLIPGSLTQVIGVWTKIAQA